MATKVGINGFGPMGRNMCGAAIGNSDTEFCRGQRHQGHKDTDSPADQASYATAVPMVEVQV